MSGRVKVFNLQIYLEIISFCDVCTLSRLMRTCTTLHHHGVKVLLQDVYISSQEAMKGFYEFFRTNDFARAVYLHSLQLNFKDVSRSVGRIVATILRRATQLRTFNLDYAEAVIQSCYPNISNALGDLGALRELILNRSGKLTWDTVAKMEVPLETLVMTYDGTGEAPFHGALSEEDIPDYHPLYVCGSFASTLRRLTIRFSHSFELESVPYHVHAIYPNLRHLAVCDNYPFLRHWIEACPNVACLSSSTFEGEWPYVYGDGDLWEQIRQRNLEDQLENGTWKHLEEYNGYEVLYLYLLGLPCRIPRLTLNRCPVRDTGYIDMLRVVLADAKPTHLTVPIGTPELLGDAEQGLCGALCQTGTKDFITTLMVSLWREERLEPAPTLDMMTAWVDALAQLPYLVTLKLDIRTHNRAPSHTDHTDGSEMALAGRVSSPPDVERETCEFDLEGFARRSLECIHSLMRIEVAVSRLDILWRTEVIAKKLDDGEVEVQLGNVEIELDDTEEVQCSDSDSGSDSDSEDW